MALETAPNKLNLNPLDLEIFEKALASAYEAGIQNAMFMTNSMHSLVKSREECVKKLLVRYYDNTH